MIASLQRGDLQAVYDSSFDSGYGSAAWCIDGNGSVIRGVNIVPIDSDTLDATQCELAGIYIIMRLVEYMIQYFVLKTASIAILSNCEEELKWTLLSTDKPPLYYVNGSHLDLINAINHIRRTSILQIRWLHIPSHQANSCIYENLD